MRRSHLALGTFAEEYLEKFLQSTCKVQWRSPKEEHSHPSVEEVVRTKRRRLRSTANSVEIAGKKVAAAIAAGAMLLLQALCDLYALPSWPSLKARALCLRFPRHQKRQGPRVRHKWILHWGSHVQDQRAAGAIHQGVSCSTHLPFICRKKEMYLKSQMTKIVQSGNSSNTQHRIQQAITWHLRSKRKTYRNVPLLCRTSGEL